MGVKFWLVKEHRFNGDSLMGMYTKEEEARADVEHLNEIYQTDTYFVEAMRD